ncbi:hypothetical protein E1B28_004982 [Marasmius oreades]|uniref:Uncharacterized protein n=1 Tax=Marasmius oreades TaxID=181124 RepID=A0A9P7UZT7_9AGAR|nr:uncharacterized protein E1B28_004982 [Marasmius oreades]KAG7097652.1 hypothetical protein E1B28_004982 [Marasmius oreades]
MFRYECLGQKALMGNGLTRWLLQASSVFLALALPRRGTVPRLSQAKHLIMLHRETCHQQGIDVICYQSNVNFHVQPSGRCLRGLRGGSSISSGKTNTREVWVSSGVRGGITGQKGTV